MVGGKVGGIMVGGKPGKMSGGKVGGTMVGGKPVKGGKAAEWTS